VANGSVSELQALSALAARLIPLWAPWGQFKERTVVRPGAVAPDLPADFPLPAGSRLIGSCTSGAFSLTLVDTGQSPQGTLRFYERELGARGWYRHAVYGSRGFLREGEQAAEWALFCRSPRGPSLRIGATPRPPTGTELHLQLETDAEHSPCASPGGVRLAGPRDPLQGSSLPLLIAPPGAIMQIHGTGGGGGSYQAHATMRSDLDLGGIGSHFRGLIEEAGWRQERSGETGPVNWSSWACRTEEGEEVKGFFFAFRQGQRLYSLQLDRDTAPGSRKQAEIESREQARAMERAATRDRTARVEIGATATGGIVEALRELILRIVAPADPNSPDASNPELFVGRMPNALPVELPLPPRSRVLGGLVLDGRTTIYLESETPPSEIVALYRTHLPAPSWNFLGEKTDLGGFAAPRVLEAKDVQFCPEGEGPAISIEAHARPDGVTDAQINLVTDLSHTPCGNPNVPPAWQYRNRQPGLPKLIAPVEADFAQGGGHGGEAVWEARGYLYTTADLGDVAEHYSRQFEAAGWKEQGRGGDEVVAWSQWSRRDDWGRRVDAIFLAVRHPGSGGYSLTAATSIPTC
jgi:hypothetical protein